MVTIPGRRSTLGPAISDGSSMGVKSLYAATEMLLFSSAWKREVDMIIEDSLTICRKEWEMESYSHHQIVVEVVTYCPQCCHPFNIGHVNDK